MRRRQCLPRPRGDAALEFCLAAERVDLDEQSWLEGVTAATLPLLPRSDDYAAASVTIEPDTALWTYTCSCTNSDLPLVEGARIGNAALTSSQRDQVRFIGVQSFRSFTNGMPQLRAVAMAGGVYELATLMASAPTGVVTVFVHLDQDLELDVWHRTYLFRLAGHLSRTSRLRHSIATAELADAGAVFSPDGRCAYAQPELRVPLLQRFRAQVLARERVRAHPVDAGEVLAYWASGTLTSWTVLDHFEDDGRRWIVVWPNPLAERGPRALAPNERRMLTRVLEGWSNRAVAAELGLSYASASRTLTSALRKLGLRDLAVLSSWRSCELAGELLSVPLGIEGLVAIGVPSVHAEVIGALTSSERAVLAELVRGRTNRQIGNLRGTSERTVANQVRMIFDKLGVGSRRELLHRLGGAELATRCASEATRTTRS